MRKCFIVLLGDRRNEYSIPAALPNPKWGNLNERALPKGEGSRFVESEYIYSLSDYFFFFFLRTIRGPLSLGGLTMATRGSAKSRKRLKLDSVACNARFCCTQLIKQLFTFRSRTVKLPKTKTFRLKRLKVQPQLGGRNSVPHRRRRRRRWR